MSISAHAVDRFRERVAALSHEAARAAIAACLEDPSVKHSPTANGVAILAQTKAPYAIRAVIQNGVVTTVMPASKGNSPSDARHRRKSRVRLLLKHAAEAGLEPLRVIARTPAGFTASDDWSPSIDGILAYWFMREALGEEGFALAGSDDRKLSPVEGLPLLTERYADRWWYCASSPIVEEIERHRKYYHRRFDALAAELHLAGAAPKALTKAGAYKNTRLNHVVRVAPCVVWHVIGDKAGIERLLRRCSHIGKGMASGMGHVAEWIVTADGADPDLALMHRPVTIEYAKTHGLEGLRMPWGLVPPGRIGTTECVMPS